MISLHVYINPKSGRQAELEANIRDRWLAAMSTQPGFISAAVLTPFADDALEALGASKPKTAYQVVSFWESEGLRLEWVARPIHDGVHAADGPGRRRELHAERRCSPVESGPGRQAVMCRS